MREKFRAYLLSVAGVSNLISTRAYWGVRPQGSSLPALVMTVVSAVPAYGFDGHHDLDDMRIQIDAYGDKMTDAVSLAKAVRVPLDGKRFTQSGVTFESFLISERDFSESGKTDADRVFRISMDFNIFYGG